jgi:hypothetical protein
LWAKQRNQQSTGELLGWHWVGWSAALQQTSSTARPRSSSSSSSNNSSRWANF